MNKTGGDLHCPLPHRYLSNPAILPLIGGGELPTLTARKPSASHKALTLAVDARHLVASLVTLGGNGSRQSWSGAGAGGSGKALCVLTQSLSWTRGGGGDLMVIRDHMGTWAMYVSTFHLQL